MAIATITTSPANAMDAESLENKEAAIAFNVQACALPTWRPPAEIPTNDIRFIFISPPLHTSNHASGHEMRATGFRRRNRNETLLLR